MNQLTPNSRFSPGAPGVNHTESEFPGCDRTWRGFANRTRDYTNLEDPNNGITHGCDGDWVVERICQFSSPDTEQRIVVCYCSYQPIEMLVTPGAPGLN
ncbi:MAG: hypothetical protein U7123_08525 [Potamolinea sp.]